MRRFWIVLTAVAMILVVALPVLAKKPDHAGKPSPDPVLYDVRLTLDDAAEGLGACEEQPSLVMTDIDGALLADGTGDTSVPRLWLRAAVPWQRTHPPKGSGDAFDECHGGVLEGSESNIPSYFIIHSDRSGYVTNVLWAFDAYVEEGTKGKDKIPGYKEYFRLWGTEGVSFLDGEGNRCPLNPTVSATCLVKGVFEVWHYYPIEQIGEAYFEFELTIERR